ncbi:MAG: prephenate dehydrogenase/arogenate dehydrogenase family protein, partial [Deltaproteobacteria bacterium]|nr:prephenate dehydrogenase/arogenate dehydrogenase family protein [Deltaproteobacteria bacterium]
MGGLMVRLFSQAGYGIRIGDVKSGPIHWEDIAQSQVIILAVPVTAIDQVMSELGPLTRPDGVIIDICSLKEAPLKSMLAHAQGEVIGSHPLFGPSV